MCAYGKTAATGFEKGNVSGRPTSTVREYDCLKRTQATHLFLLDGWAGRKRGKAENTFSFLSCLFFLVLFSLTWLWYRLMYHSY